jgi:hypothetical protein
MKNILLFLVMPAWLMSCNSSNNSENANVTSTTTFQKPVPGDAIEGVGVHPIFLGEANKDTVLKYFSDPSDEIAHRASSVELIYKDFGISFFYLLADTNRKIIAINCDTTFKGKTQKGFLISSMTVRDMIKIYGRPYWQPLSGDETYARYEKKGIYFTFNKDPLIEEKAEKFWDFGEEEKEQKKDSLEVENLVIGDGGDNPERDSIINGMIYHFYDSAYANYKVMVMTIKLPGE